MVAKQKTKRNKAKAAKPRNIFIKILFAFAFLIRWFLALLFRRAQKNPLLATGFSFFALGFLFITYNALYSQTSNHHGVFIETRPSKTISLQYAQDIPPPKPESVKAAEQVAPAHKAEDINTNRLPSDLLEAQKKLKQYGLYNGPLDGRNGPKTRNAISLWNKKNNNQTEATQKVTAPEPVDDIASLIEEKTKTLALDKITTKTVAPADAKPQVTEVKTDTAKANLAKDDKQITASITSQPAVTQNQNTQNVKQVTPETREHQNIEVHNSSLDAADIMRVQAGLRAFGNSDVSVTGVEDQTTVEALTQFQKMFSLEVTGKINQEVIDKMREIGLSG